MAKVLQKGPWKFCNHLVIFVRWRPTLEIMDVEFHIVDYTIQVHGLPEFAFTQIVAERIAECLPSKSSVLVRVLSGKRFFGLTLDIYKSLYRWVSMNFPIQGLVDAPIQYEKLLYIFDKCG